jgi:quercetin dioxygenase-like cupin family protein
VLSENKEQLMTFIQLSDVPERELVPGFFVRFVHTENVTLAYWSIKKGSNLPDHFHSNEQTTTILEGRFQLTVESETRVLEPGMVAVIPPNAKHHATAISDCRLIEVFYPIREDYR